MLSKLLKYDFKMLFRFIFPCVYGILAASVLGAISISVFVNILKNTSQSQSNFMPFLIIILTLVSIFLMLVIFGAVTLITVGIFYSFYKNLFSNEGYLTFTLPVDSKQILLSKIISGFVCMAISYTALFVGVLIMVLCASLTTGDFNLDMFNAFKDLFAQMNFGSNTWFFILEVILAFIVFPASSIMITYNAIILGGTIAKKYKLLAAIGFAYLFSFITQLIYQLLLPLFIVSTGSIMILFATIIVFQGICGFLSYIWSSYLLKNKLNI